MKQKRILSLLLALMMVLTLLPTNLVFADEIFAGGSGTSSKPYQIETLAQLTAFAESVNDGEGYSGDYVELTADIDMSSEYSETTGTSWTPIGTNTNRFLGTFNGNGHTVNVYYNGSECAGLFGYIGENAVVENVGVTGTITTSGALVGGIAGKNSGTIENCYNAAAVTNQGTSGVQRAGGIAGFMDSTGSIKNCYDTGDVTSTNQYGGYAGGIVGYSDNGSVVSCYMTGNVTGSNWHLYGAIASNSQFSNCYYIGTEDYTQGSINIKGIDEAALATQCTFSEWDFDKVWIMDTDRPLLRSCLERRGTEVAPYTISNLTELEEFRDAVNGGTDYDGKFVRLMNDIDMSDTYDANKPWTPIGIGNNVEDSASSPFSGTFDGGGHAIKGLYVDELNIAVTDQQAAGLFGYAKNATIRNLAVAGSVKGKDEVGGIVGKAYECTIQNCRNSATVTGDTEGYYGLHVGGIAGYAGKNTIEDCYNVGEVKGRAYVGGITGGDSYYSTTQVNVKKCYSIGTSTATENTGWGMIIGVHNSGTLENLYCLDTVKSSEVTYADEKKVTVQTADEFASGEVTYALQASRTEQVWGQELGKDNYPTLTSDADKAVHKITFATSGNASYAKKYVNHGKTLAKKDFPDEPTSADGKVFHHWSQTNETDGDEFDATTKVTEDITVYAVGMEKTGAATGEDAPTDKIKGVKNGDTININLNNFVTGEEGAEWHFTFKHVEGTFPEGVTFNAATGVISGQPKKAKYGKVVFDVTNDQIAMMSLDDTGTKLELTFDISFTGEGTSENPYLIEELEDLEYLRDAVNDDNDFAGEYIKIKDNTDIDMSSKYGAENPWTPIGIRVRATGVNIKSGFAGTFEGNNRTIKNLYVKGTETDECITYGLFGYLEPGATVRNLTVEGSVTGRTDDNWTIYVGGVVGNAEGDRTGNDPVQVQILNCTNKATVQTGSCVGGVVGNIVNGVIEKCSNEGEVTAVFTAANGTYGYVGGIVGTIGASSNSINALEECTNKGKVTVNVKGNKSGREIYVGGVVGEVEDYYAAKTDFTDCINEGAVQCTGDTDAVLRELNVGGVAGYLGKPMKNCKNDAAVSVTGTYAASDSINRLAVGGVAGKNFYSNSVGDVDGCTNTVNGAVTVSITDGTGDGMYALEKNVGGIIGRNDGRKVLNCINEAKIIGEGESYTGGIAGENRSETASIPASIISCINKGEVQGGMAVGGIAGKNNGQGTGKRHVFIQKCYNTAAVTHTGFNDSGSEREINVGGIVGDNRQVVENCYSTAPRLEIQKMTTSEDTYEVTYYVGGVVGQNMKEVINSWSNTAALGNTVEASGGVTTNYKVGGVVGANGDSYIKVQNCYFLNEGLTLPTGATNFVPDGVSGCTEAQLKSGEVAWLLQNGQSDQTTQVWGQNITLGEKDAYPMLTDNQAKEVCKVTFLQTDPDSATVELVPSKEFGTAYTNYCGTVILPTTNPTVEGFTFDHWAKNVIDLNTEFTAQTQVMERDTKVYAVGKEQTETASTAVSTVTVQKGATYTAENSPIDLNDQVQNKSGNAPKNFSFGAVDKSKLPEGLTVNTDGKITGTPTKAGYYTVTIGAENHGLALMSTEGATGTDASYLEFDLTIEVTLAKDESGAYIISDLDELEYFRDSVNKGNAYKGETVKLTKNINMSEKYKQGGENWTPIGESTANAFNGTFDGNGHTINGLYAYYKPSFNGTKDNVGLFGFVETNGSIKNLSMTGSKVGGKNNVGGIVGTCKGTITGCSNSGNVAGNENVGGIVGYFAAASGSNKMIENCRNEATVWVSLVETESGFGNCSNGGGIVGKGQNVIVRNCSNSGELSGGVSESESTGGRYNITAYCENIGGIAGLGDNLTVENCYNSGEIEGVTNVGGLVGTLNGGTVRICYNNGAISLEMSNPDKYLLSVDRNCGALVGTADDNTDVQKCYYLKEDELKAVGNKENNVAGDVLGEVTKDDFAGGVVAAVLEDYASENAAEGYTLTWGQKLSGTDVDSAPVLTSDTAAKVYPIALMVNVPWSDTEANRAYKKWKDVYGNKDHETELPDESITVAALDKPGRFRDWSKTENGEPLAMKYTPTGENDTVYSLWNTVTFDVPDTEKTYAQGVAQTISFTPYLNGEASDAISADDFTVTYYEFDENADTLKKTDPVKAKAQGTYLYVISAKDDTADNLYYIDGEYKVTDGALTLPSDWEKTCKNIGIMTITPGVQAQQEPIFFEDGAVSMYVSDGSITNKLTNNNGDDVTMTVTSNKESVATVAYDTATKLVTVTAVGKGTATITAKSEKSGTSPVYASFTVTVTKEVITVTADDKTITYGEAFTNATYQLPSGIDESKIQGPARFDVDYQAGDGVGKYEIEVSGLTSDIYDIEYKSGKLKVEPKTLNDDDFVVSAEDKEYDRTTAATVTATVKTASLGASDDVVNVLVSGNFDNANAGFDKTVYYTITGLSGKDSSNYKMETGTIYGEKTADITQANVKVNAPKTTTYVYDGDAKSVNVTATANNGIYFDSFAVTYQPLNAEGTADGKAVPEPKDQGTYKVVVTLNDDIKDNYTIENDIDATLIIKSAQQDFFSIEGISDTVTYGDKDIKLQTAGAIEGGTVTWEVLDGTAATVDANTGAVTINGVGTVKVQATSEKDNYNDKTATRTFVIQPKTLTVTASADSKVYDGTKDVKDNVKLTPNGIEGSDAVSIDDSGVTATVATADVENGKTVFVNGLALKGDKSTNYKLAATSMQTSINITQKEITAVSMTAKAKTYDGTEDATYTIENLEGVIGADKNFVTVTGTATFEDSNVGENKTVTLSDFALSGTKSGNYKLKDDLADPTCKASINKATVNVTFGTMTYVYDGKVKKAPITATVNGIPFVEENYTVKYEYGDTQYTTEPTNQGTYTTIVTLKSENNVATNYEIVYSGNRNLVIEQADQEHMTITGLPGTVEYGAEFVLYTAGGYSDGTVTWAVTEGADYAEVGTNTGAVKINGIGKVTIQATNTDANSNYNPQTATITFTPTKKQATFKITGLSQTYDGNTKSVTVKTDAAEGSYTVTYTDEDNNAVAAENLKNAGTYYVEVKAKENSNYTGEQSAVLTIKKATIDTKDISIGAADTTYTGSAVAAPTVTWGGAYKDESMTYSTLTYTGTGISAATTSAPKKAGTYTVTLTIDDPNCTAAPVTAEFKIAKATLTATAKDQTREYGQNNEPLTVELTGFVTGEDEKQVLIMPIASTTATSSSDVNTYDITVSGGYAENYDFEYKKGTLTVEAATEGYIDIRNANTNPYVGDSFKPEAWFNGQKINAAWTTETPDILSIDENGKVTVNGVGEATLTATATSANCKGLTTSITINARKKQITLDQFGTTVQTTYTGAAQPIAFTAGSVDLTNVTINTTYMMLNDTSKTTPVDVGTYMVMYTIADELYEGSGTCYLTINKANVAVKAKDAEKTYGDEFTDYKLDWNGENELDASVKDDVLADIKNYVTFTSEGAPEAAEVLGGGYPINVTASQTETANVKFTVTGGTLTVDPATLIITVSNVTRAFGEENPTPEVTYNDFVTIGGVKETTDVLEGELVFTYADGETPITAETAVGPYTGGVKAGGVSAKNYAITFVDGDVIITPIGVTATAGTARATYLTVRFDKALAGLTDANFTVQEGDTPVALAEVNASSDNKTYTLKGTFAVGTTYTVTIDLTGTAYAQTHAISGSPLTITPSNPSSGGGGGGGGASSTYTVKFETNGGSAIDSVKVTKNQTVTEPAAPTKEGFEFGGWYADKKLTAKYDFAAKVTKAMTLYAAWTEKEVEPEPTPSVPTWTNPFTDVKESDWFYESVKYANENGLMSGMTETLFAPDEALTRGMLVTVLYRAEGEPAVNRSIPFADVKADSYYADAVNWAQQNEIVKGVSETEFAPDENITREQIATIMFRYAKYQGVAPEGAWAIRMDYADVADIADYATEGVMYCTLKGIMQGKDNHMFAPKENASRAEIAAILGRYIAANQ